MKESIPCLFITRKSQTSLISSQICWRSKALTPSECAPIARPLKRSRVFLAVRPTCSTTGKICRSWQTSVKTWRERSRRLWKPGTSHCSKRSKKTRPLNCDLMQLPGIGAKRVQTLHNKLDINNLDDLQRSARKQQVRELDGFGEKTENKILKAIENRKGQEQRTKLSSVVEFADSLVAYLQEVAGVKRVVVAGSYRRCRETIGDLDILVTCKQDSPVMDRFVKYDEVDEVVSKGTTKSTVLLRSGLQVDLRKVADESFGSALHYFTGSKAHNIALRRWP